MLRIREQALCLLPLLLVLLTGLGASPAAANEKYAAIVVDANSGRTLFAENADARRYPASLTKMMTLYVLFEEIEAGRFTLESRFSVSAKAAAQAPSKLGVKAGSTIKVEDAILALTTKSANDVAVAIAENVSGSVSEFAARMNREARALGMMSTTFRNPNGLPDTGQVTTARDLIRLATGLQDRFPAYYKYFGARSFTYKGRRHRNHNRLLGSVQGVDGIKTGYTRASGFNLVSNVRRDGRHIIAVVLGGRTASSRDAHMRQLISKYLPKAKRGARTTELVLADAVSSDSAPSAEQELVAAAASPADAPAALAELNTRVPRPRPGEEPVAELAYAPANRPRDVVAAAMAAPAEAEGDLAGQSEAVAEPADPIAQQIAAPVAPPTADPIAQRISDATEVAELAALQAPAADDPIARLTRAARERAGAAALPAPAPEVEMVAAARPARTADPAAGEAGWHIQIGAVPTEDGAQALIQRAQASMGPVLASLHPLTQEVQKNGATLYRARFAGLSDKEAARKLCAKLERKSINCLAVPN